MTTDTNPKNDGGKVKPEAARPKLTKAQSRDLLAAAANGGIALGLCYGPWETLIRLGLAEAYGQGQNIKLTEAGWQRAKVTR